jgi:hypothetical protein
VLLECRGCHTLALQPLSLVEVEFLEIAGLVSNPCAHCDALTLWGYPQRAFEVESKAYQAAAAAAGHTHPLPPERRKSPRKPSQLPAWVRDYYCEADIILTENISQEGFCFISAKKYLVSQGILVICPFNAENQKPEVRARIVRAELPGGLDRHLYGVRYVQPAG